MQELWSHWVTVNMEASWGGDIILSKINVKGTFAQFMEEGLCIQGKGWMKRKL